MTRILIADDHSATRKGVKHILSDGFSEVEFGEAADSNALFERLNEKTWDLLILDMEMPCAGGIEICRQLKDEHIRTRVLLFSEQAESQSGIRAFKAGACGYLSKEAADTELRAAVQQILSGRKYITSSMAELLALQLENPLREQLHNFLSNREYQTLVLIAQGNTITDIAKMLFLSKPTVSTYRSRILEKLGMKNNAEITGYAIRNKLV